MKVDFKDATSTQLDMMSGLLESLYPKFPDLSSAQIVNFALLNLSVDLVQLALEDESDE